MTIANLLGGQVAIVTGGASGLGLATASLRRARREGGRGRRRQLMPEGMKPDIHSVTAEGERVVFEFEGNGTLVSGEPYGNQYCMVFIMRDGRIRQVNEYFCTILADQKLWPLVEGLTL